MVDKCRNICETYEVSVFKKNILIEGSGGSEALHCIIRNSINEKLN